VLPGSGGLECDIGSIGDVISPKRGSLGAGLTEVQVMLKVNAALMTRDIRRIPCLGDKWEDHIPKRPELPPKLAASVRRKKTRRARIDEDEDLEPTARASVPADPDAVDTSESEISDSDDD